MAGQLNRPSGFRWERFKKLVFITYGDICHICQHGGARQVDHLESLTEHPELGYVLSNCRPAHGAPRNRCPVCGQNCNQLRGSYSVARARKIIAERSAGRVPEPPRRGRPRGQVAERFGGTAPEPPPPPGRDW